MDVSERHAGKYFVYFYLLLCVCTHAAACVGREFRLLDLQKIGGAANSAAQLFALL